MDAIKTQLRALGERIKRIRTMKGLTQAAVAASAGLDVQYYNRVENGKTNPTFITMAKVSAGLGIDTCPGFLYLGALNAPTELAEICTCAANLARTGKKKELRQTRDFMSHVLRAEHDDACDSCIALSDIRRKNPSAVVRQKKSVTATRLRKPALRTRKTG